MGYLLTGKLARYGVCVGIVFSATPVVAQPQRGSGVGRPDGPPQVYQRRAVAWASREHNNYNVPNSTYWRSPPVASGWFQRPYPYHLDYYRMRYGGSYAPYFGNLYGPPQVVTVPPYYGPYVNGYGYPLGFEYGGGGGPPLSLPDVASPPQQQPTQESKPVDQPTKVTSENLPTPSQ